MGKATYQLVENPKTGTTHIFAGCSLSFCGRDSARYRDHGLHPKTKILSSVDCCERCKKALINRDGVSDAN